MIARAPAHARAILGKVLLVAGSPSGPVRWSGWSEVWEHPDGRTRVAFPKATSLKGVKRQSDNMIHIRIKKETFIPERSVRAIQ